VPSGSERFGNIREEKELSFGKIICDTTPDLGVVFTFWGKSGKITKKSGRKMV
jgi:hypothetical protein